MGCIDPRDTCMAGDALIDICPARESLACGIAVSWAYHDRESLEKSGFDSIIDDPYELVGIVL